MERVRRRAPKVQAALEKLGGEATARQIAAETGLQAREVGHLLHHMKVDGVVTATDKDGLVPEHGTKYTRTWRLASGVVR